MTLTLGTEKKFLQTLVFCIVIIVLSSFVSAFPVPFSISGFVFDEDGKSQAIASVSVKNLNNSFYVESQTGIGLNKGMYSIALKGDYGDVIVVKAWDGKRSNSVKLPLEGVIRDANLRLHRSLTREMVMSDLSSMTVRTMTHGKVSGKRFVTFDRNLSSDTVLGFGDVEEGAMPAGGVAFKNDEEKLLPDSKKEGLLRIGEHTLIGVTGGVSLVLILAVLIIKKRNDGKKEV